MKEITKAAAAEPKKPAKQMSQPKPAPKNFQKQSEEPSFEQKQNNFFNDADPLSRQSIARLTQGGDDLLSDHNAFDPIDSDQKVAHKGKLTKLSSSNDLPSDDDMEDIDEDMINEIEEYLKGVMENNEEGIDMSDSAIGSSGAKCVGAAISFCERLEWLKLANCNIGDAGARNLFEELLAAHSVTHIDLSQNPISEKCFDALAKLL